MPDFKAKFNMGPTTGGFRSSFGGEGGMRDHQKLHNRDAANTHPLESITGLEDALAAKIETETDPTVPSWAKAETKPSYTAQEVGAQPEGDYMVRGEDYVTAGKKQGSELGYYATAEGYGTTASGTSSHAEGDRTVASFENCHAEGSYTTASGYNCHAEGYRTTASFASDHAEGSETTASGGASHAEGTSTLAGGLSSHAEGTGTIAAYESQHVSGEYNIVDPHIDVSSRRGDYAEIVGNGTSNNNRSNARTLSWSGNETLSGKLTVGAGPTDNMDVTTKLYVDTAISNVDALPDQSGQSGKFLATDGTDASWANVPEEVFIATKGTTTYAEVLAAVNAGKVVYARDTSTNYVLPLVNYTTVQQIFYFRNFTDGDRETVIRVDNNDSWQTGNTLLVPTSRTINGYNLASNVTLTASDVGAQPTLPSQSGNSGKFLTTDGTDVSWATVSSGDPLPSQTGHSGEFLTTNGTAASWADLPTEVFVATYGTTTYADVLAAYNAGKFIVCDRDGYCIPLSYYKSGANSFEFIYQAETGHNRHSLSSGSGWGTGGLKTFVQTTRTINGYALSSNITLTASDVGAQPALPTQSGNSGKFLTTDGTDVSWASVPSAPSASSTTPAMDGTAAAGTETAWAHGDHVHPTDTSRQAKITASGLLKGDGNGGITAAVAGTDYLTLATLPIYDGTVI